MLFKVAKIVQTCWDETAHIHNHTVFLTIKVNIIFICSYFESIVILVKLCQRIEIYVHIDIGGGYYLCFIFLFLNVTKREKLFQFKSMHMMLYTSIEHVQIIQESDCWLFSLRCSYSKTPPPSMKWYLPHLFETGVTQVSIVELVLFYYTTPVCRYENAIYINNPIHIIFYIYDFNN